MRCGDRCHPAAQVIAVSARDMVGIAGIEGVGGWKRGGLELLKSQGQEKLRRCKQLKAEKKQDATTRQKQQHAAIGE